MEKEMTVEMAHPDYAAEIARLIQSNLTPKPLRERLLDYHEKDIAECLPLLQTEERRKLYRVLGADTVADILEYAEDLTDYLNELELRRRAEILSLYRACGGTRVCLGSDAHTPARIAQNFPAACKLLLDCGFTELTLPTRESVLTYPIPKEI